MRRTAAELTADYLAKGLVNEPRLPTGIAIHDAYKNSLRVMSLLNACSMSAVVERLILDQCARMCAHWDTRRETLAIAAPAPRPGARKSSCFAMARGTYAKLQALAKLHGWLVAATLEALIEAEERRAAEFKARTGGTKKL